MLVQLIGSDFSTLTAATLTGVLLNGTTPIDITGQTLNAAWFSLQDTTPGTPTTVTIASVAPASAPADATAGKFVITFNATTNSVTKGDVLVLGQGSTVTSTSPFSRITNTASIDTQIGTTTGLAEKTFTPVTNSTKATNYNLSLNFLSSQGSQVSPGVVTLSEPVVINGLTIASIKFTQNSTGGNGNTFNPNVAYNFTVTFYAQANAQGDPIIFEGGANDIIGISFVPV